MATKPGAAEYRALSDALRDITPPCTGDRRFILDSHEIAADELSHLALTVCRPCPLSALCRAYGAAERPKAGIWGGRTYKTHAERKPKP